MSKHFVQINGLKSNPESEDENSINVKFENESVQHINFTKLADINYYSDSVIAIKNKIYKLEGEMHIKEESIKLFIQFFQNEKISIPIDHFKDVYILSVFFNIAILTRELDNICQKELFDDLNIIIQILQDFSAFKAKFETNLINQIETIISSRINECFKNPIFSHLPVSTIYKILSVSNKENLNTNLLVDFISDSVDNLFILFDFVEIEKVPTEKIEEIIKLISRKAGEKTTQKPLSTNNTQNNQIKNKNLEEKTNQKQIPPNNVQIKQVKNKNLEEKTVQKPPPANTAQINQTKNKNVEEKTNQKQIPTNNVQIKSKNLDEKTVQKPPPANNIQIKQMKNKSDNLIFQVNMSRNEIEEAKEEISRAKLELEKTKEEMRKAKEEMERLKKQEFRKRKK